MFKLHVLTAVFCLSFILDSVSAQIIDLENFGIYASPVSLDYKPSELLVATQDQAYYVNLIDSTIIALGRKGKGPFEYGRVGILKFVDDSIYIWDRSSYKLIEFDKSGYSKKEYLIDTRNYLMDFSIKDSLLFAFVEPFRSSNFPIVNVFNLKNGTNTANYGNPTTFSSAFYIEPWLSPFSLVNESLLFANPDDFILNKVNIKTQLSEQIHLPTHLYAPLKPIPQKYINQPGYHFEEVMMFVYNNNFIMAIDQFEDHTALLIMAGKMQKRRSSKLLFKKINDPKDKFNRLVFIDGKGAISEVYERPWLAGEEPSSVRMVSGHILQLANFEQIYTIEEFLEIVRGKILSGEDSITSILKIYPLKKDALLENGWKEVTNKFK